MTRRDQPETILQCSLIQHLRWCAKADVWFCHLANGGARSPVAGAIFKSFGVRSGAPDLLIVRAGQALFIECKAPGRKLSLAQIESTPATSISRQQPPSRKFRWPRLCALTFAARRRSAGKGRGANSQDRRA